MSTGLNCHFYGVTDGTMTRWYYLLEDWDAPKMAWDWRDYATCYGPFHSEEAANEHLRMNHANPGGSWTNQLTTDQTEMDEVLKEKISKARK